MQIGRDQGMELTCFRPPFRDELLYGWLVFLAENNYPFDSLGIQRVVDQMFPYGKTPGMRGIINKEPARKDYLRGLDKSIQELKVNGYKVPGTADIITYNTPLVAIGIAQDKGDQARYIHTAVSTNTGGLLDMPTLPLLVSQIRYCPVCMCTVPYVRTWHNLPGVDSCAIHKVDLCSLEDTSSISWQLERSKCMASSPEKIAYAKYVKSVYDHPTDINILIIRSLLSDRGFKISTSKKPSFSDVINHLLANGIPYPDLIKGCPSSPVLVKNNRETHISKKATLGKYRCAVCGNKWTDALEATRLGFYCPDCMSSEDPDKLVSEMLRGVGDGRYRLNEAFRGLGVTQIVIHDTCGLAHPVRMASKIWHRTTCRCEVAHTVKSIQERVDGISTGFTVEDYIPTQEVVTVSHNTCGQTRKTLLTSFLSNPVCPYCRDSEQNKLRKEKLQEAIGNEYEILELPRSGENVRLLHKPCGNVVSGKFKSFLDGKGCPLCVPYLTRKRKEGEKTVESTLLAEMNEWFKHNPLWIARRHCAEQHTKSYYEALQVLVKKGFVYRVDFGIYSNRDDLSVYEILRWKYLLADEGNPVGRFTGDTARYLEHQIMQEPEIITLESALLLRKSWSSVSVKGRKVKIRGI